MKFSPPPVRLATLIAILLLLVAFVPSLSAAVPPGSSAPAFPAAFSCDNVTEISKSECEALVALYNSANGPGWKNNAGWLQTNTPCNWFGVTCEQGYVIRLYLYENQLSGPIPSHVSQLTRLQHLDLADNQLSGTLPPQFGQLTELRTLWLGRNQLSGPIPAELGQLIHLSALYLTNNQLNGPIPPQIGQLTQLQYLGLAINQLTGVIPPELGQLTLLQELRLSYNQLSGTIPPQLSQLGQLQFLGLSENQLSGVIPPQLSQLIQLQYLYLSENRLSGVIPPQFGQLAELKSLGLSGNQLTGAIPPQLGLLTQLRYGLSLDRNRLSGVIPPELGRLTQLQYLLLSDNFLTGPLPSTLTALQLTGFWYERTDLCEPGDANFQHWLDSIEDLEGTGVVCGAQTVTGLVWNDANRNGAQDAGEAGLTGATVTLTQAHTAASIDGAGRRVFTDKDGRYRFDYVATGPHAIAVAKPGYFLTDPDPVQITVPASGEFTVPPIGISWAPTHIYLPMSRR